MATSDQIISLIKAFSDNDKEKFKTVSLQIAAYEAMHNHENTAREIKKIVDSFGKSSSIYKITNQNKMLDSLLPTNKLTELIVSEELHSKIARIITEYKNRKKLAKYGMCNRRKILLEGTPGTGKTFTASVISGELGLPLYIIQMDKILTKFMGETSVKLRQIFDEIISCEGVYLFDEFDAIGADRNLDNEVGEARRILNSFLQFIEQDFEDSIVIAATNNKRILDQALFRRFDDVLHYSTPTETEIRKIFELKFGNSNNNLIYTDKLVKSASGLCQAEIINACNDTLKDAILNDKEITEEIILKHIQERNIIYNTLKEA